MNGNTTGRKKPRSALAIELYGLLDAGRKKRGVGIKVFADEIGCSYNTYNNWKNGTHHPERSFALNGLCLIGFDEKHADALLMQMHKENGVPYIEHDGRREREEGVADQAYRDAVVAEFETARLFGPEQAHLKDVFVWPRAKWKDPEALSTKAKVCGELYQTLTTWLHNETNASPIKLLMGGPGSGKSSFARAMASYLASQPNFLPVLVPLHRFRFENDDPIVAMQSFLSNAGLTPELAFATRGPRPVFLFDGLDELVLPESDGVGAVSRNFARWLGAFLGSQPRAAILVTGRNTMMQAFEEQLTVQSDDFLELTGLGSLGSDMQVIPQEQDVTIRADQRPLWWEKYAAITGEPTEFPEIFDDVLELSEEPLICYLIAISGSHKQRDDLIAGKEAALYGDLIDSIWTRRWGSPQLNPALQPRIGIAGSLPSQDFNGLLEAIAHAAWQDGANGSVRVATMETFGIALRSLDLDAAWRVFERDMKGDMAGLALTFYFNRALGVGGALDGFEFSHQTFGEFLLARLLLKTFKKICVEAFEGATHEDLLLRWLNFVSGARLNGNTISLLQQCGALTDPKDASHIAEVGRDLLSSIIRNGMPIHRVGQDRVSDGKALEQSSTNAQAAFLNCLSAIVMARDETRALEIEWRDQFEASEFLSRFLTNRIADGAETLGIAGLSFAVGNQEHTKPESLHGVSAGAILSGIFLAGASLNNTLFFGANLDRASLSGCTMIFTEFTAAQLTNADLTNCVIANAIFDNANLHKADLRDVDMQNTSLAGVKGQDAVFRSSRLSHCTFRAAVMPGARFTECTLADVDFAGADIQDGFFDGATFQKGVSFRDANLSGADFTNANAEFADFTGAIVGDTVLDGATLPMNFSDVTHQDLPVTDAEDEEADCD